MKKNVDYDLLVRAERVRFQTDFSSAHWLHQVLCKYTEQTMNPLRRGAFESVIRCAITSGCAAAIKLAATFPEAAGFPDYLFLEAVSWEETKQAVIGKFDEHISNRFKYVREGD